MHGTCDFDRLVRIAGGNCEPLRDCCRQHQFSFIAQFIRSVTIAMSRYDVSC